MIHKEFKSKFINITLAALLSLLNASLLGAQENLTGNGDASASKESSAEKKKSTSAFTLGEVVVRDWSIANVEDASTSTVINGDDIEARSEKIISDTLQMVPGVQVIQQRKGNRQFMMRGYGMESIALLVDGIPMTDAYGQNMDIDNISVLNVERIVVNRGTSSALYGTNGAAGSINIVTKKPATQFGEAKAEFGPNGSKLFNMAIGAPMGNFYYWITSTYDISNGYDVSQKLDRGRRTEWVKRLSGCGTAGYRLDSLMIYKSLQGYLDGEFINEYTKYQVSGKMGYTFTEKIEAGINASWSNTEKKNSAYRSGMLSSYSDELDTWSKPIASDVMSNMTSHWPEYYNTRISPYVSADLGRVKIRGIAFFNEQSNTLEAFSDPYEYSRSWSQTENTATWSIWKSRSYGINLYPSWKMTDWNNLNMAVAYRIDNHNQHEQAQRRAVDVIALYGHDKFQTQYIESGTLTAALEDEVKFFNDRLKMSAGVSYDAQKLKDFRLKVPVDGETEMKDAYIASDDSMIWGTRDSINPVISVLGVPIKDLLTLRGAASIKSKFPNLSTYAKIVPSDETPSGKESVDSGIKSERSYNASGGAEIMLLADAINLRGDYFYSRYSNKIDRVWNAETEDWRYLNLDASSIQGIELTASGKYGKIWITDESGLSLSYTYTNARNLSKEKNVDLNKGELIENTPVHKVTFDLRSTFVSDTTVAFFGYITMDQFVYVMDSIPAAGASYSTGYFKKMSLHDPLMLNFKITQRVLEGLDIYIICSNILDDYAADPLNPGAGRVFSFGGSAKF